MIIEAKLELPGSVQQKANLLGLFHGLVWSTEDPESKAFFSGIESVLSDSLPAEMVAEIVAHVDLEITARRSQLERMGQRMAAEIQHMPPDQPATPGGSGLVEFF